MAASAITAAKVICEATWVVLQREQGVGAGERPLVVLVWDGAAHYDAALSA